MRCLSARGSPMELAFPFGVVRQLFEPVRQHEAHAHAARLLAEMGRPAERVAAHVLRCPPAGDPDAVDILRAAARRSLADGVAGLAAEYLERALAEPPPAGRRAEVLVELGAAELNAPRAAEHLRQALKLTHDPARRAQIARGLGRRRSPRDSIANAGSGCICVVKTRWST